MSSRSSIKSSKSRIRSQRAATVKAWHRRFDFPTALRPSTASSSIQTVQAAASNVKTVKLVYAETVAMTGGGAGATLTYSYRANSIYDPRVAIGGHQPMAHDEWANFYNHYRVIGSKITLKPVTQTDTTAPLVYFVTLGATSTAPASADIAIERGRCAYGILTPQGDNTITLKNAYDAVKFFGTKVDIGEQKALFTADPAEGVYFHIGMTPLTSSSLTSSHFVVEIEYTCQFTEPRQLGQS